MSLPTEDDNSEVQEVWDQLRQTKDPSNREALLVRLAECALDEHDFTDLDTADYIHDAFTEMRAMQERYHLASMRVGRLVAQLMDTDDRLVATFTDDSAN